MIVDYEKFRIPDENKEKDFFVEVNWQPGNPRMNESKILRFTFPNGETAHVKKEHLLAMLFAIGKEVEQRKMLPQKLEPVHWRRTVLGVKATKDIRKGEEIRFPIEISFPCTLTQEIIGDHKRSTSKGIVKPTPSIIQ